MSFMSPFFGNSTCFDVVSLAYLGRDISPPAPYPQKRLIRSTEKSLTRYFSTLLGHEVHLIGHNQHLVGK